MHIAIYLSNQQDRGKLIHAICKEDLLAQWLDLTGKKLAVFSKITLNHYLNEEYRHDRFVLTGFAEKRLADMSEGEQKRQLLTMLLSQKPDVLVVDDVFDSFDVATQQEIASLLAGLAKQLVVVQLMSRYCDKLAFITHVLQLQEKQLIPFQMAAGFNEERCLPPIPEPFELPPDFPNPLIKLDKVSVNFAEKPVLHEISWIVNKGEFWQLKGPNGSGKSTLLRMISGDNPKGFGQNLYLFGRKKGSGESVWEIKKQIGYFTSSMTLNFSRSETVQNMLISGFFDSVGLYQLPHPKHVQLAQQWLALLGMESLANKPFEQLSLGQQRLLLAARAMVKHPPVLILDEPTAGLDDEHVALLLRLVNHMANNNTSAIIYVSHRDEIGLNPQHILQLQPSKQGSIAIISDGKAA